MKPLKDFIQYEPADEGMEGRGREGYKDSHLFPQTAPCSAPCSQGPQCTHRPPMCRRPHWGCVRARRRVTHIRSSFSSLFPFSNKEKKKMTLVSTHSCTTRDIHPSVTREATLARSGRTEPSGHCLSSRMGKLGISQQTWQSTSLGVGQLRKLPVQKTKLRNPISRS